MNLYLCLQYLLLLLAIFAGYFISKDKSPKFWFVLLVIFFTFVEGSRFGRGIDYNVYADIWEDQYVKVSLSLENFVFRCFCKVIYAFHLPYQLLIYFSSSILILGGLTSLKRYKEFLIYSLPIFIFFVYAAENLFRWYTAFGFLLLALNAYLDKKYKIMAACLVGCLGVHVMLLPYIIILFLVSLKKNVLFRPIIAFVIFIVLAVIWENSFMKQFSYIVTLLLAQSDHYSAYSDSAVMWLTASNRDDIVYSIQTYIMMFVVHIPIIYIGHRFVEKNKGLLPFYNMYILGFSLYPAMSKIELFDRYNQIMIIYYCIFSAVMFKTLFSKFKYASMKVSIYIVGLSVLSCLQQFRTITLMYYEKSHNKWYSMYIWDAHGRQSIDIEQLKE